MRTWPRISTVLSGFAIIMLTQTTFPADAQECPGGYAVTFELDGEVNLPKTYALQDFLRQGRNWTRVQDFFLTGSGSDGGTFTGILLWDLLQKAEVKVDPARRNDLSRKSVLITGSDCYEQLYSLGELEPRLGGSHQVIVAFMRDNVLLGEGEGMARIINPGDKAGARRVFNITRIRVLTPPPE
jgi:hypothetical protein